MTIRSFTDEPFPDIAHGRLLRQDYRRYRVVGYVSFIDEVLALVGHGTDDGLCYAEHRGGARDV